VHGQRLIRAEVAAVDLKWRILLALLDMAGDRDDRQTYARKTETQVVFSEEGGHEGLSVQGLQVGLQFAESVRQTICEVNSVFFVTEIVGESHFKELLAASLTILCLVQPTWFVADA
jgi:hypothetical protein